MESSLPTPTAHSKSRFHAITDPIEWAEDYRPGMFHPVHLGDTFKDSRFKILRKLGYGSFSTVWLARDQELSRFVAIKILTADASKTHQEITMMRHLAQVKSDHPGKNHVMEVLDDFEIRGPNGNHQCLVFEPMGPSSSRMFEELPWNKPRLYGRRDRYPIWMAKSLLRQVLLGIAFLHQKEIVHGDLQPGNILFSLDNINKIEEKDLAQAERKGDISQEVKRLDGLDDPWAPRYLALIKSLDEFTNVSKDFKVKISDLGAAFLRSSPPKKPDVPVGLRSPELVFSKVMSESQDVWSFGCLIYEFLTGTPLFPMMVFGWTPQEEVDDEIILLYFEVLGPIPDNLLAQWPRSSTYFNEKGENIKKTIGDDPAVIASPEHEIDGGIPSGIPEAKAHAELPSAIPEKRAPDDLSSVILSSNILDNAKTVTMTKDSYVPECNDDPESAHVKAQAEPPSTVPEKGAPDDLSSVLTPNILDNAKTVTMTEESYVPEPNDDPASEEAWSTFSEERRVAKEQGDIDEIQFELRQNEELTGFLPLEQSFDREKPVALGPEEAEVVKTLLRQILQYDPKKRPSVQELLEHPWFRK